MDLYFCDICNESVPQTDLDRGSARRINERVVCASCDQAMSLDDGPDSTPGSIAAPEPEPLSAEPAASSAPPPAARETPVPPASPLGSVSSLGLEPPGAVLLASPPASRSGGMFLIGLIAVSALVVTSLVTVEFGERIQKARIENRNSLASVERSITSSENALRAELTLNQETQRNRLLAELEGIRAAQSAWRTELGTQFSEIESKLSTIAESSNRLAQLEGDSKAAEQRALRLSVDLAELRRDLDVLVERWFEAVATGDVVEAEDSGDPGSEEPEWMASTENLSSPSADTRWSAVNALGETKDEAVVPFLLEMLKDQDIFVRVATARIFGDLGSDLAVSALIDALSDETPSVREVVVESLRKITGENFRFDPNAREVDRNRRIKAWRDWWAKSA